MRNRNAEDVVETEVAAPTVSEAIQKGLIELGATREEVKIEILSEGRRGFLGLFGAEEARVRLRLRRPRSRAPEPSPEPPPAPTDAGKSASAIEEDEVVKKTKAPPKPAPQESPAQSTREAPPPAKPAQLQVPPKAAQPKPPAPPTTAKPEVDVAEIALEAVQQLIEKMGVPAQATFRERGTGTSDSPVIIEITGENLGVLIGEQGTTLQALQYVTRLIVSRHTHSWANIVLDVDGYRQRREETLTRLAHRIADRVRKSGRPISLEPMQASERRIIHLALHDDPDVTTGSVGQGDNRKVIIRPRR